MGWGWRSRSRCTVFYMRDARTSACTDALHDTAVDTAAFDTACSVADEPFAATLAASHATFAAVPVAATCATAYAA